jgi:hypothetical protein
MIATGSEYRINLGKSALLNKFFTEIFVKKSAAMGLGFVFAFAASVCVLVASSTSANANETDANAALQRRFISEANAIFKKVKPIGRPVFLDPQSPNLAAALEKVKDTHPYIALRPTISKKETEVVRATMANLQARLISVGSRLVLAPSDPDPLGQLRSPVELIGVEGEAVTSLQDALSKIADAQLNQQFVTLDILDRDIKRTLSTPFQLLDPNRKTPDRTQIRRVGETLIVSIVSFEAGVALPKILSALADDPKIKRVAFDLRVSAGGSIFEVIDLLRAFAPEPMTVLTAYPELAGRREFAALKRGPLAGAAVEVWISRYTYSAAEIFAHSMVTVADANLIGGATHGKCVAQKRVPMSNGDTLLVPVAEIRDRFGQPCVGHGAQPRFSVPYYNIFSRDFPPAAFRQVAFFCTKQRYKTAKEAFQHMRMFGSSPFIAEIAGVWRNCSSKRNETAARRDVGGDVVWVERGL